MMSSNGNIFCVTGHLCGEFTGPRGAFMYSLICVWINSWVNNREAGDLGRSFTKMHLKLSSAKWQPLCSGGNELRLRKRTSHDDVIKWKHFPRNWPFVREIHRSPVNFPHKGQWRGALMFSLIYAWINDWVNNREAGDLRRQRGHYDVIVMGVDYNPCAQLAIIEVTKKLCPTWSEIC